MSYIESIEIEILFKTDLIWFEKTKVLISGIILKLAVIVGLILRSHKTLLASLYPSINTPLSAERDYWIIYYDTDVFIN